MHSEKVCVLCEDVPLVCYSKSSNKTYIFFKTMQFVLLASIIFIPIV